MDEKEINRAITLLETIKFATISGIKIIIENEKKVFVIGWTNTIYIENLNKEIALKELQEIKNKFHSIIISNENLKKIIENKEIEYHLAHDEIGVCYETSNGDIIWV